MLTGRLLQGACGFVFMSVVAACASAGVVNPPWDPSLPRQTLQAWMFGPGSDPFLPTVVDNPNGMPQFTPSTSAVYLPDNPLTPNSPGTGVWCLTGDASLSFFIPNYNELDPKEIFISIKYSVPAAGAGVPTADVVGVSGTAGTPIGNTYTPEPVSFGVSMIHYHQWLPTCEPFRVSISLPTGLPGAVGYIEQVVVQTVCVPSPGGVVSLMAGMGIVSVRRRR